MRWFLNTQISKPLLLISTRNKVNLSTVIIFKQSLKMHVISIAFYTQLLIYNLNIKTCLCSMSGLGFSFKYILSSIKHRHYLLLNFNPFPGFLFISLTPISCRISFHTHLTSFLIIPITRNGGSRGSSYGGWRFLRTLKCPICMAIYFYDSYNKCMKIHVTCTWNFWMFAF